MPYAVAIQDFEGPFDLLLQLVEREELDITNISLVQVTEPFLQHLNDRRGQMPPEELVDFLVIAAKLVYLKSKAIVPTLQDPLQEEGPDLATQLRTYQAFVAASKHIQELASTGARSFGHPRLLVKAAPIGFIPPTLSAQDMPALFTRVIRRLEPIVRLPQAAIEKVMTLEEKMADLIARVKQAVRTSFHAVASETHTRSELIVTFLAILELTKQRSIVVQQAHLFEDIHIAHL